MQLIDGKMVSKAIREEVRDQVAAIEGDRKPTIALVRVGDDPASTFYVKSKTRACAFCGIESRNIILPEETSEAELLGILGDLNADDGVDGILLQLPVPGHIDSDRAILCIDPTKDVDGFHPENLGLLASGKPRFVPCTPLGMQEMMERYDIDPSGKRVAVIGRSVIVGKPMAMLLSNKAKGGNATVTLCHSRTPDIGAITRECDIIVAAIGSPHFVTADMVREGAVVFDVGINRVEAPDTEKGYRVVGDVDFDAVAPRCSKITPVPGGVGLMTVAMLMANTYRAYVLRREAANAVG
jgi:methylenetetrahydrofolate dehydrogenase (NADP+)/methenyltetrahydrofolate cyclohydrolase